MNCKSPEGAAVDTVVNPRILLTRQANSEELSNCHLFTDDVAHSTRYGYDNDYLGIKNIGQGCPAHHLQILRQPNIFGKCHDGVSKLMTVNMCENGESFVNSILKVSIPLCLY
jgi:hypothetical protein